MTIIKATEAALAAQPERKPMTAKQVQDRWSVAVGRWGASIDAAMELASAVEAFHGITEKP
jgi:uncharacterized protein (DUF2237 family)